MKNEKTTRGPNEMQERERERERKGEERKEVRICTLISIESYSRFLRIEKRDELPERMGTIKIFHRLEQRGAQNLAMQCARI